MPGITSLPMEILIHIFTLVPSDSVEYMDYTKSGKPRPMKKNQLTQNTGNTYKFDNKYSGTRLMPDTISKLSLVCKDFAMCSNNLWQYIYISYFRNDIPYKINYSPEIYRKKYLSYIKFHYEKIKDYYDKDCEYLKKMIFIKDNNASIYYKYICQAVESMSVDFPYKIYYICDLMTFHRSADDSIEYVSFPIRFDRIVASRVKCLDELNYYKRSLLAHKKIILKCLTIIKHIK
tara:strand:- start:1377 stop:2075 length:699 start_codon:yes stop_codon:yes gene_type:complete